MVTDSFQVGDKVRAWYKSGGYIGEIAELSPRKAAVRVLAVTEHPAQGDLHNPLDADVAFFHQRRALAFREIALMPYDTVEIFEGDIPDYESSLKDALERAMQAMRELPDKAFGERALRELEMLQKDYFSK